MSEAKKTAKSKVETKKKQTKHAELVAESVPVDSPPSAVIEVEEPLKTAAKAGKRSSKAARQAAEKQIKDAKKAEPAATAKSTSKPPRSRADRAGKKYREALKLFDTQKQYSLSEAVELAAKTSTVKFDASVELHINLCVDPKQADHNIRDTVALPAGTGKVTKIAVVAEDDAAALAKKAGADLSSADKIFEMLDKEKLDFDILIATPTMMAKLGKYARLLGPRGLMPNPKSGTVTVDVAAAVAEAKAGRVEYRVDQSGIIHLAIGKASFTAEQLSVNAQAVMASIRAAKPASLKGIYIKSLYATSSMGPSIKIDLTSI